MKKSKYRHRDRSYSGDGYYSWCESGSYSGDGSWRISVWWNNYLYSCSSGSGYYSWCESGSGIYCWCVSRSKYTNGTIPDSV